MTRMLLTTALALSFASSAIGQAPQNQQGMRERGERLCGADASRLCRNVIRQGDFAVLACFQENVKQLSQPCHDFLVDAGQIWPAK
jgi:hypothetical protein